MEEVLDRLKTAAFIMAAVAFLSSFIAITSCVSGASSPGSSGPAPGDSLKRRGEGNPLMTQRFSADPCALSWRGRVYVYSTRDVLEFKAPGVPADNSYRTIRELNCVSSDDLANWTDHGAIGAAGPDGICSWASNSWAPAVARKVVGGTERFFLYFANGASGIGVMSAPSPLGPWTDAVGGPLVSRATENCSNIVWLFDPAVLVDGDGKAYLYFGGGVPAGKDELPGTARCVELGADMVSLAGIPRAIDAPFFFEDSGINEADGVYYYSYCANWADRGGATGPDRPDKAAIAYMTSDGPLGPWTYGGILFRNPGIFFGVYGNNHHALVEHGGSWFFFYHTELLNRAMAHTAKGYRSVHADAASAPGKNAIESVRGTMEGAPRLKALDPYRWTEAETMARMAGVSTTPIAEASPDFSAANMAVSDIERGDWISVSGVDFGAGGPASFTVLAAGTRKGCAIRLRLDSPDGPEIGRAALAAGAVTGRLAAFTIKVRPVTGVRDLYLVFEGSGFEVDRWRFEKR